MNMLMGFLSYGTLPVWGLIQLWAPRQKFGKLKLEWKQDLLWFAVAGELFPRFLAWSHLDPNPWFSAHTPVILNLGSLPYFAQAVIAVLILDFVLYWFHRSFHAFPILWEQHKAHHSTIELTAISGHRGGIVDIVISGIVNIATLRLLGVNFGTIGLIQLFYHLQGQYVHANIDFGSFHDRWFCSPNFHRWHHSADLHHKNGQNFGVLFPWWDRLFGTEYVEKAQPKTLGFEGIENYPKGFFSRMFYIG